MTESSYDPQSRSRLCLSCGATNPAPLQGGEHTCPKCDTSVRLSPRRLEPLGDPAARQGLSAEAERARQEKLRQQDENYDWSFSNPYSTVRAPRDLEVIDNAPKQDPKTLEYALAQYPQWCQRVASGADASDEQRLFWLTGEIFNMCVLQAETLRAWGVIQTSLDLVTDPGYQQMLRCMAAEVARLAGQPEHAEAWLALCDPVSSIWELDYYLRSARALLLGARGQWTEAALALAAGPSEDGRVPTSWQLCKGNLRATAFEKLGRPADAERALEQLLAVAGVLNINLMLMGYVDPMLRPALAAWSRLDWRTSSRTRIGFFVFFLLATLAAGWGGLHLWTKSRYHATWKTTKGKLLKVYTRSTQHYHITKMHVGVVYTYQVKGRTHRGNRARPDAHFFTYSDSRKAEAKLVSLKSKSHVTVYYDPAEPGKSALQRKASEGTWYALGASAGALLLLAITLLILRFHVRRRRALSGRAAKRGD